MPTIPRRRFIRDVATGLLLPAAVARMTANPYGPLIAGSAGSFSPASVPNLFTWVSARDLSTLYQDNTLSTPVAADGDPVGGWVDKSTNGHNLLQSTSNKRPLYKTNIQNGQPAILFDGSNDDVQSASFTLMAQPFTYFVVFKDSGPTSGRIMGGISAAPDRAELYWAGSGLDAYAGTTQNITGFPTTWQIVMVEFNGASSFYRRNGGSRTAFGGTLGTGGISGHTLGSLYDGASGFFTGYIAEAIVYSVIPSTANEDLLFTYLNSFYAAF